MTSPSLLREFSFYLHSKPCAACFSRFNQTDLGTGSTATSGTSAYRDDDEVMEDAVTSNLGMISAILSLFGRFNYNVHHWVT